MRNTRPLARQLARNIALLAFALTASVSTQAQTAGSFVVSTGWLRVAPQVRTDTMRTTSIGGRDVSLAQPGPSSQIGAANTLGLTATYFVTGNIAAELVTGVPPKFHINGAGTVESLGGVGSARMWSPAVLVKYYFGQPTAVFRPFVGLGASYVWFTGGKITNDRFAKGALGGDTQVSVSKGVSPVFNLGATYNFAKNWYAGVSISYLPMRRTITLTTPHSAKAGGLPVKNEVRAQLNPIVTYVSLGYRF